MKEEILDWIEDRVDVLSGHIDNVIDFLEEGGNHILDRMDERVERIAEREHLRIDALQERWDSVARKLESGAYITNTIQIFIAGAIVDMQNQMIIEADKTDWKDVPEKYYNLLDLGDRIITELGLDISDWDDEDTIRVPHADGSYHHVTLDYLILDEIDTLNGTK